MHKPKIVFFGNERLATGVSTSVPTLQLLIEAGYSVVAVVSHYERSKSRNARVLEIAAVAEKHGIPLLLPNKPSEIIEQLAAYEAEAAVLAAYGRIVPQSVIDIFPKGILNIHPSLLPLHRGPTPIESVILEGAAETGVSIMQLVKAMDAGPVYDQTRIALQGKETKQQLADTLLEHGAKLLLEVLPGVLDGSLQPQPQEESKATYDRRLSKEDGILDFAKSAEQLEREIRAYAGWPRSRTTLFERDVIVTAAYAETSDHSKEFGAVDIDKDTGIITIQCNPGQLVIERLMPAGKKEMAANDFIAGYCQS